MDQRGSWNNKNDDWTYNIKREYKLVNDKGWL